MSVIDQIDKAVAIIPRGALFKSPLGPTHVNRTFEGEFCGASLTGRRASLPEHSQTHMWESEQNCPPPQKSNSRDHISWEDVFSGLALVVGMADPVTGPCLVSACGWESIWPPGSQVFPWVWPPCLFPPSSSLVSPHCGIWAKSGWREHCSLFSLQFCQ